MTHPSTMHYYLAGPMTGIAECNYPMFTDACRKLRELGLHVISPHEQYPVQDDSLWLECLRRDLITLLTDCEAIILLPGWQKSKGAKLELSVALALEMPVFLWRHGALLELS